MNKHFLQKVAERLVQDDRIELSKQIVVLPNKRAGLFLKNHLSKLINKPTWLPEIVSTEELIDRFSEVQLIDNTTQLFELYACYRLTIAQPESFDEFIQWGQILLHDFNEIDRYLIDTQKLFKHVNEARALEVWNVDGEALTDLQKKYLKFWEQLGQLYVAFTAHLASQQMAYQGLAYRIVANKLATSPEQFIQQFIPENRLLFAGFNALNKAEEELITTLKNHNKCDVIFDADEFYMNDDQHEAGLFMRKFKSNPNFEPFEYTSRQFKEGNKEIKLIGIPQNVGQAKYLSNLLNKIPSNELINTAIVLADEQLLVPVLQSIPSEIEHINVTMGYPLRNTTTNNFFDTLLTMIVNAERFGNKKELTYHYRDVLKLLQLPLSKTIFDAATCQKISAHIIKHNWVFIRKEKLDWINERLIEPLPSYFDVPSIISQCLSLIEHYKTKHLSAENKADGSLELEYLFHFAKLFNQLQNLITKYPYLESAKAIYGLYRQLLVNFSIDLYGEPLKGLQVLGMLETRTIDFKHVILLSANEGILPAGKTFNSFIPFDIKKAFQLPTHIEKDAIYAYHFYRLLQYAEDVHVLYNTETNEFGSGEQSRFVTQIENELPKYNNNIKISKDILTYPTSLDKVPAHIVKKTPEIIAKMKTRFEKGLSPSAITTYLTCPMDFYYNYVLGIGDPDEVEETIQMNTFGDYVHKSLELLYQPLLRKVLKEEDLKGLVKQSDEVVVGVFQQHYSKRDLQIGKNLLSLKVAQNYVKNYLKQEMTDIQNGALIEVTSIEENLVGSVNVNGTTIALKGKADRIQQRNDVTQIVDFKTGKLTKTDLGLTSLKDVSKKGKDKCLQVLMYAYLYGQQGKSPAQLQSGVFSFRLLKEGYLPLRLKYKTEITEEVLTGFEEVLQEVIGEILNPEIPFIHDEEAEYCQFC